MFRLVKTASERATVSSVRPAYPLKCNPILWEGIFARMDDSIRADLHDLAQKRKNEKTLVHKHVLECSLRELSADRYSEIQTHFLADCENASSEEMRILKFLCFSFYIAHKVRHIVDLGLHRSSPLRILDVATGAGHFPMIAHLYGHEVIGLDMPFSKDGNQSTHLFDVLCEFFRVAKVDHKIVPMQRLPSFPHRFDLVTSFIPNFNLDRNTPWGDAPWRFFIEDVVDKLLAPGGCLYMTLTEQTLSATAWGYLRSVAEFSDDKRHILRIRKM